MSRTYSIKTKDREISVSSNTLDDFRKAHLNDYHLDQRMSELIWLDMYIYDAEFGISPHDVLSAIRDVEAGETTGLTKSASQFQNEPLAGLWHKHFFSAHFVFQNIKIGLGKDGLEKLIEEIMDPARSSIITQDMINELSHRVTHEPFEKRARSRRLTGEWIIYIKHEEKQFYLCCNSHDAGDQLIFDRISQHCRRDFPALASWIADVKK